MVSQNGSISPRQEPVEEILLVQNVDNNHGITAKPLSKNTSKDIRNDYQNTILEDTISFNESKMTPCKENKDIISDCYLNPAANQNKTKPKSEMGNASDIVSIQSDEKNCSANNSHEYDLMADTQNKKKSCSDKQIDYKLINEEPAEDNPRRMNILQLKNISKMKSKLPPSRLPNNKNEEIKKEDKLSDKLQAMQKHESSDETSVKNELACVTENINPDPQFLGFDNSQESLEELARIDAELAKFNEEEYQEPESSIIFVSINFHLVY